MMKKTLLILITVIGLNASSFNDKIMNIIGANKFNQNRGLINHLFAQESNFYKGSSINYITVMEQLKKNGLLDVGYKNPQDLTIVFKINSDPIKSLKIVSDSLKALGYYHYFTKHLLYDENSSLTWTITLKTEAAIDPLVLSKELFAHNCWLSDIKKEGYTKWMYNIDTSNSILPRATKMIAGEKVDFRKPLKPYLLRIADVKTLKIRSKYGNQWFPNIVFYDKHLDILKVVKKQKEFKNLELEIPENTVYIKIDDLFTLANIRRGLSVTTKE
jgi:hypothetical protein